MMATTSAIWARPLIVGVGGCSSSGKSTLVRSLEILLDPVIPVFVMRQDRFFRGRSEVPIHKPTGHINWDSPHAMNTPAFLDTLARVRSTSSVAMLEQFWADAELKYDGQTIHGVKSDLADKSTAALRDAIVNSNLPLRHLASLVANCALAYTALVLVDGFLLFESPLVAALMDSAVFLDASFATCAARRAARSASYVCPEGTVWTDPPDFFSGVTWPEYLVNSHAVLDAANSARAELSAREKKSESANTVMTTVHKCSVLVINSNDSDNETFCSHIVAATAHVMKFLLSPSPRK